MCMVSLLSLKHTENIQRVLKIGILIKSNTICTFTMQQHGNGSIN